MQGTYTVVVQKASGKTILHHFSVEEYGNCHCSFKFLTASPMGHENLIEQGGRSDQDVQHGWENVPVSSPSPSEAWRLKDLSDLSPLLPKPQAVQRSSSDCPPQQGSHQEQRMCLDLSVLATASLTSFQRWFKATDLSPAGYTPVKCHAMSLGLPCLRPKVLTFWCRLRLSVKSDLACPSPQAKPIAHITLSALTSLQHSHLCASSICLARKWCPNTHPCTVTINAASHPSKPAAVLVTWSDVIWLMQQRWVLEDESGSSLTSFSCKNVPVPWIPPGSPKTITILFPSWSWLWMWCHPVLSHQGS